MNWYEIMERELKRAGSGAELRKVPKERRASKRSLLELERTIKAAVEENAQMRFNSRINNL